MESMVCVLSVDTQYRKWEKAIEKVLKGVQVVSYRFDMQTGIAYVQGSINQDKLLKNLYKVKDHVKIITLFYPNLCLDVAIGHLLFASRHGRFFPNGFHAEKGGYYHNANDVREMNLAATLLQSFNLAELFNRSPPSKGSLAHPLPSTRGPLLYSLEENLADKGKNKLEEKLKVD